MIYKYTRYLTIAAVITAVAVLLSACHDIPEYKDSNLGNFDALVDIVGERYCFFEEKDIDWQATAAGYRKKINSETGQLRLFELCADMLATLEDGHVNLSSRFNTSYYRKWWTDYPQDFNLRTLQEHYLDFNYGQTSGIIYKMLPDSIGYIYYPSFSTPVSQTSLDYILAILYKAKGLIIDIRNNGGGLLTNIDVLVSRFIDHKITGGYISHKTGPGYNEFSEPYEFFYEPCDPRRISWPGKVALLTNRSCFSAANNFVAVMKTLPQVTVIGAKTGGGGGLPFSSELPNGWSIRFSACPIYSPAMESIENGIEPTEGYETHCTDEELAAGIDRILDRAIELMRNAQ